MKNILTISGNTSLGELVTYYPEVTERLTAHHIDFCCQGERSLEQAIMEAGLDQTFIDNIINDYQEYLLRPEKNLPVSELSDKELIEHIMEVHHVNERKLWKEIDPLINKILLVHYEHGKELLLELHHQFSVMRMKLEAHFAKEECELFPAILISDGSLTSKAHVRSLIKELEAEHDVVGDITKSILRLTNDFKVPDYACYTVIAVYTKLHELIDDIYLHVAKENSVLFRKWN